MTQLPLPIESMKHAANARAYALGQQRSNGFHVRKIVWGRLMATAEKRQGEEIRAAIIMVRLPRQRRRPRSDTAVSTVEHPNANQ